MKNAMWNDEKIGRNSNLENSTQKRTKCYNYAFVSGDMQFITHIIGLIRNYIIILTDIKVIIGYFGHKLSFTNIFLNLQNLIAWLYSGVH